MVYLSQKTRLSTAARRPIQQASIFRSLPSVSTAFCSETMYCRPNLGRRLARRQFFGKMFLYSGGERRGNRVASEPESTEFFRSGLCELTCSIDDQGGWYAPCAIELTQIATAPTPAFNSGFDIVTGQGCYRFDASLSLPRVDSNLDNATYTWRFADGIVLTGKVVERISIVRIAECCFGGDGCCSPWSNIDEGGTSDSRPNGYASLTFWQPRDNSRNVSPVISVDVRPIQLAQMAKEHWI